MSKQKRMIYVYEENLAFYESLDGKDGRQNKSEFINDALQDARIKGRVDPQKPKHDNDQPATPSAPLSDTEKLIEETRQRDLAALRKARQG